MESRGSITLKLVSTWQHTKSRGKKVVLSVLQERKLFYLYCMRCYMSYFRIIWRKKNRISKRFKWERQNWICVAYFLFQHLMNLYIYLLIVNRVKLERVVIYINYIARVTPISFQKTFWLADNFIKLILYNELVFSNVRDWELEVFVVLFFLIYIIVKLTNDMICLLAQFLICFSPLLVQRKLFSCCL